MITPKVLVIIATLGKRYDYLNATLQSIQKQNYPNLDIVMIYPSKSTETKELADRYGAHSLQDPGSMSEAVNDGIRYAKNNYTYATWIGDDDLLEEGMIENSVRALESNPKASASFGYCHYINADGKKIFTSRAGKIAPWLMSWGPNLVPLPGSMFRISSLKKLDHLFDPKLRYSMDLDIFLRLKKVGPLVSVGRPVSSFRWHSDSTTVAHKKASLDESEMVKRRNLSKVARVFAPIWEKPVRIASIIASKRVDNNS